MIQPDEIRHKAGNLYPKFLRAWLAGEAFFPRVIPSEKRLEEDHAAAGKSVRTLEAGSKDVLGYGYTVEWAERKSRTYGRNRFPQRIVFETQDDFLRCIGRQREFEEFTGAVERIRSRCPELEDWIRANVKALVACAADVEPLLEVVEFFRAHPRPMLFAREIPLSVDTKFIENHKGILRQWLDRTLPPHAIRADEEHFERRFFLRYDEPQLFIRFLDPAVQEATGCPWPACSVPLHSLAATPIAADRVLIVENKVNLLTLPPIEGGLALGGLGSAVNLLGYLSWLSESPIWYWGDLDVEGFSILSRLRTLFPHTRSAFMGPDILSQWSNRPSGEGTGRLAVTPANLTDSERAAFNLCASENLRIEQERIPHWFVLETLQTAFDSHSSAPRCTNSV